MSEIENRNQTMHVCLRGIVLNVVSSKLVKRFRRYVRSKFTLTSLAAALQQKLSIATRNI